MIDRASLTPATPFVVNGDSVYQEASGKYMSVYVYAQDDGTNVSGHVWFLAADRIDRSAVTSIAYNPDGSVTLSGPGMDAVSASGYQTGTAQMTITPNGGAFAQSATFTPQGGAPIVLDSNIPFAGGFAVRGGPAAA